MSPEKSDALVFFGATGDLAHKKIFPALQALARSRGARLGVLSADHDLEAELGRPDWLEAS